MKQIAIFLGIILTTSLCGQNTIQFKGQASTFLNFSSDNDPSLWLGARYIPQLGYEIPFEKGKIDFELSSNIFGNIGMEALNISDKFGKIKPYRVWARYSTNQFELRVGLQKINFGSSSIIRPLMWFDQMDPTDPLQLTDGVWGILARYYFLNNMNIWTWLLYGNNNLMGWEAVPVKRNTPEFGGRFQLPLNRGEIAFSYNHRNSDPSLLEVPTFEYNNVKEDRFGIDTKMDLIVGVSFEFSHTWKHEEIGQLTHVSIANTGIDYTFPIGNGLSVICEQLLTSGDESLFALNNINAFSLITINYPLGLLDNLGSMIYYDWTNDNLYGFLTWQRQYDNLMIHFMGFLNPDTFQMPAQSTTGNFFAGKGFQIMLVFNH